jgi:hypothetical protein
MKKRIALIVAVAAAAALVSCSGSGGSRGQIQLPMGSGTWDIWWCPDCSKVIATQDGPPTPAAVPVATVTPSPAEP